MDLSCFDKSHSFPLLKATRRKSVCTSSSWTFSERATWTTASGGWTKTRASSSSPPNTKKSWRLTGAKRKETAKKWPTRKWPELWETMEKLERSRKWRRSSPTSSARRCWITSAITIITDEETKAQLSELAVDLLFCLGYLPSFLIYLLAMPLCAFSTAFVLTSTQVWVFWCKIQTKSLLYFSKYVNIIWTLMFSSNHWNKLNLSSNCVNGSWLVGLGIIATKNAVLF